MDDHEAQVLADLEQEVLAPAVRRLRRRFCAATAMCLAGTGAALALIGLAALPVLVAGLLVGALALVARTIDRPERPTAGRIRQSSARPRRQPLGCSTKS